MDYVSRYTNTIMHNSYRVTRYPGCDHVSTTDATHAQTSTMLTNKGNDKEVSLRDIIFKVIAIMRSKQRDIIHFSGFFLSVYVVQVKKLVVVLMYHKLILILYSIIHLINWLVIHTKS